MSKEKKEMFFGAALLVLVIAIIWFALTWNPKTAFDVVTDRANGDAIGSQTATEAHGQDMKTHKETTARRAGDIRGRKEIEVRALPADALVDRHLDALARFRGISHDRAGAGGVGRSGDILRP